MRIPAHYAAVLRLGRRLGVLALLILGSLVLLLTSCQENLIFHPAHLAPPGPRIIALGL